MTTDSERVQALVGNEPVAQMAGNITYPYPNNGAQTWIASHGAQHRGGTVIIRAIVSLATNQ